MSLQNLSDVAASAYEINGNNGVIRWFDLLASDAAREVVQITEADYKQDWSFLEHSEDIDAHQLTPLQQATRIVDHKQRDDIFGHQLRTSILPETSDRPRRASSEQKLWQAQENIVLLPREHVLFENFLQRISQWVC